MGDNKMEKEVSIREFLEKTKDIRNSEDKNET